MDELSEDSSESDSVSIGSSENLDLDNFDPSSSMAAADLSNSKPAKEKKLVSSRSSKKLSSQLKEPQR